jgi:sialate O-acetylesterase
MNNASLPWGATLLDAPSDWQILQQDEHGKGRMELRGAWTLRALPEMPNPKGGTVELRLVREDNGAPVTAALDWFAAETRADGTWRAEMKEIPAGGLYRLETRFNPKGNKLGEWSLRGDTRHFLGVGDIWIVAGQSNASGYGRSACHDAPEPGLHMLRHNGAWALASHPLADATASVYPAIRENYNTGHSPFLHFARLLRSALGHPIGLVPAALGGSALDEWLPGGALFENLKAMAARAGGRVRGIAWYQGESDAAPGRAGDYLERFMRAAEAWREALGDARLPIVTAQLGRYHSRNPHGEDKEWSQVREAQRQAALRGRGITVVPALDLSLDDAIHLSSSANMVLAARLADCALGAAYGRPVDYRAPDLVDASLQGGQNVHLRFAPVRSRLDCHNPGSRPFSAVDDSGEIAIEKILYVHRDSVRLVLARKPQGGLRIHCGYGESPDPLPVDVERGMPVLAFHGVEVESAHSDPVL